MVKIDLKRQWLEGRRANVEQYLGQDGKTGTFLANVGTLPLDQTSTFIRSGGGRGFGGGFGRRGGGLGSELGNMLSEVRGYKN